MVFCRFFLMLLILFTSPLMANKLYETELIDYENRQANNVIEKLAEDLKLGRKSLAHDAKFGYLKSILKELKIPISSQSLVFSKTSFHRKKIFPDSPRAIYFNDEIYVAWIPGVEILELGIADPELGAVFYTMEQGKKNAIKIERDNSCLSCHVSGRTLNEPGFFIRSVFPDSEGEVISRLGSDTIDHTSDVTKRWGGWFVTGKKTQIHRGNQIYGAKLNENLISKNFPNTSALKHFFTPENYLTNTSDIEALMVLEHQVHMHNLFTNRHFQAIKMIASENAINEALGETGRRPLTKKILHNASQEILEYMLFSDEADIQNIVGNSNFREEFARNKPRSSNGDSLYELKFDKRMSALPCSWLIYSKAFESLQPDLKQCVLQELKNILTNKDIPEKFIHLRKTRKRIHHLLLETLPAYKQVEVISKL